MDRTLLEIFATEQTEHVERIRKLIDALGSATPETVGSFVDELLRRTHTLKGASRAVGLQTTEQMVGRLENIFALWRSQGVPPGPEHRALVHRALDGVEDILAWALGKRSEPDDARSVLAALDTLAGKPPQSDRRVTMPVGNQEAVPEAPEPAAGGDSPVRAGSELVRVSTTVLDDVVRSASELMHAAYADGTTVARVVEHARVAEQTLNHYSRLRLHCSRTLRQHAHLPELRPIADCLEYIDRQLGSIVRDARGAAAAVEQHSRSLRMRVAEVHENACRARMTPAQTAFGSFGPMVRDLASEESKQVEFRTEGLEIQADREVLQILKDPVMHMLRNAVSHGVEPPEERLASGKSAVGLIRLHVKSRGERLSVSVEDDGRGLNTEALRQRAVQKGLLTEAAAQAASPEALTRLIFHPGMTTSTTVTRVSGRGMGLSTVEQAVTSAGGEVIVRSRPRGGVTITISVPLSISTQDVLLVREGDQVFGMPAGLVEHLWRFRPADVRTINGMESLVIDDQPVPLLKLTDVLGVQGDGSEVSSTSPRKAYEAVILRSREGRVAVVVEELLDEREALIKNSGLPQWAAGVSAGAIPLEDGSVAVMLNIGRMLQKVGRGPTDARTSFQPPPEVKKVRILVVDDSVTTRAMERSLLEAHGYEVSVAVDGMEAWNSLRVSPPDLIISDVNMPRMDGFQLLEQIKSDQATARIPVILVTSLESREEQEKGLSLGADAYIVKRKFDQRELLRIVQQIV